MLTAPKIGGVKGSPIKAGMDSIKGRQKRGRSRTIAYFWFFIFTGTQSLGARGVRLKPGQIGTGWWVG